MNAPSSTRPFGVGAKLPPLDLSVVQFWAARDNRMAMIEYGPEAGGFGTIWSSADLGQGANNIALLPVDLDGGGSTEFVQFWQNGSAIGAIGYGKAGPRPGYQVSFGQQAVLATAHGGTFVAGRWRDGRGWIIRSAPSEARADHTEMQLLTLSPTGSGLQMAWRQSVGLVNPQLLVADIDGDGDDELVVYSTIPPKGTARRSLWVMRISPTGMAVEGAVGIDDDFFPVTAALAANIVGDNRRAALFLRERPETDQVRVTVCLFDEQLPPPAKYRLITSTFAYDKSGTLTGWLAVDANRGNAVDLVRFGRRGDMSTFQVFRSERPGHFIAGPAAQSAIPSTAVALLKSGPGPTGRPSTRSVINYLFNFNDRLAWALFAPNGAGTGLNLIGFQDDMGQGPGAIGFFVAKTPAGAG